MRLLRRIVRHLAWLKLLPSVLQPKHRRRILVLGGFATCLGLFEALAVGSIVPVVALLADPVAVQENAAVSRIADLLGLRTRQEMLLATSALLAALFTIRFAMRAAMIRMRTSLQEDVRHDVGCRMLTGLLKRSYEFHLASSSPKLVDAVTADSASIGSLAAGSVAVFTSATTAVLVTGALILIDPLVTLTALMVIGALGAATYVYQHKRVSTLGRQARGARGRIAHHAMQALGSIREARLMATENAQLDAFTRESAAIGAIRGRVALIETVPALAVEWVVFIAIAATLALLAVSAEPIQGVIPVLAAFLYGAMRIVPQVMGAIGQVARTQFQRAGLEAVHEVLVGAAPQEEPVGGDAEIGLTREIAIRDLDVRYRGAAGVALQGVSLVVPHGAFVGIAGPSGAGKTTLVNALLGFLAPANGQILVDGRSIYDGLRSWQSRIGFVPQDVFLLDDTVAANITFGRSYPDEAERLARTLSLVHLDGLVASLPRGAGTVIGERGTRVSGGQRQRIAIARALYGDPELVVLDEATSALDPEVAAAVDESIAALRNRKTLIVIAHRLDSMRRCDFVVFMEGGRLVDQGPMDDLLARNAAFARFAGVRPLLRVNALTSSAN